MDGWIFPPGYPLVTRAASRASELVLAPAALHLPARPLPERHRGPAARDRAGRCRCSCGSPAGGRERSSARAPDRAGDAAAAARRASSRSLVNAGGHGFYRVRYEPTCCERLLQPAADGLAAIERFNLVNDAWAATLAGLMPLTEYLDLTARFRGERDRNVWSVLLGSFHTLNR